MSDPTFEQEQEQMDKMLDGQIEDFTFTKDLMPPLYYDREGKPLHLEGWAYLFEMDGYRRLAKDTIGQFWLSTVWLGIDHAFYGRHARPLIFESMLFYRGDSIDQRRYSTEEQARQGHAEMLRALTPWRRLVLRWRHRKVERYD